MNKDIKKILIVLALYGLAGGIFYNFQELWLQENNMGISTISTILSLCSLITVSVIFLSSNIINQNKLKKFMLILIFLKTIILMTLFLLYKSNLNIIIKFLTMFEYAIDTEIIVCMYPLLAIITKDDKLYAIRGLVNDICYYTGALLVGFPIGKTFSNITISYNTYALLASILMLIAFIILTTVNISKYLKDKHNSNNNLLINLINKIKQDKISIYYSLFIFFCNISYYSIMGILLTILTSELNFAPSVASNIKLITGILAVLLGYLILSKLTFKNNYINISIKFIGRLITYIIPLIYLSDITIIIALSYTLLTSSSYSHITDAPYINRFNNNEQLAFANYKEMVSFLSRSIGTFICGYALIKGIKYNLLIALIFEIPTIIFAFIALYNLNKERSVVK